jgi:hypothetical protein
MLNNNPLIQLNNHRRDVLAELRQEIALWLSKPNHTQKLLASRSGISQTMLCDILANKRGCSFDTYEALTKALRSSGAKIVGLQEFGRKVNKEMQLNEHNMEVTHQRHVEELPISNVQTI